MECHSVRHDTLPVLPPIARNSLGSMVSDGPTSPFTSTAGVEYRAIGVVH